MELPELLVICGPTASGKSSLALEAAERLHGEVVSVDSMQLYRGLEIGTAQPSAAERARVPHHLVGFLPLDRRMDVYSYCEAADKAIRDIVSRGHLPVLAGGTGMYLRALLYGMDDLPGDRTLRTELDALYDTPEGEIALHARMAELDPAALERWRNCRRRLIRALEVRLISGESILTLQGRIQPKLRYRVRAFRLDLPSDTLKSRIALRAKKMLDSGWIPEAEKALAEGILDSPTAHQAIGYRQIGEFLAGRLSRAGLEEGIITATWQYARRQRTWFNHQHPEAFRLQNPQIGDIL